MKINYREYLQSDKWQTIRRIAMKRAGNQCQVCGSENWLQVHHKNYRHLGREEKNMSCLAVLCDSCHRAEHATKKVLKFARKSKAKLDKMEKELRPEHVSSGRTPKYKFDGKNLVLYGQKLDENGKLLKGKRSRKKARKKRRSKRAAL